MKRSSRHSNQPAVPAWRAIETLSTFRSREHWLRLLAGLSDDAIQVGQVIISRMQQPASWNRFHEITLGRRTTRLQKDSYRHALNELRRSGIFRITTPSLVHDGKYCGSENRIGLTPKGFNLLARGVRRFKIPSELQFISQKVCNDKIFPASMQLVILRIMSGVKTLRALGATRRNRAAVRELMTRGLVVRASGLRIVPQRLASVLGIRPTIEEGRELSPLDAAKLTILRTPDAAGNTLLDLDKVPLDQQVALLPCFAPAKLTRRGYLRHLEQSFVAQRDDQAGWLETVSHVCRFARRQRDAVGFSPTCERDNMLLRMNLEAPDRCIFFRALFGPMILNALQHRRVELETADNMIFNDLHDRGRRARQDPDPAREAKIQRGLQARVDTALRLEMDEEAQQAADELQDRVRDLTADELIPLILPRVERGTVDPAWLGMRWSHADWAARRLSPPETIEIASKLGRAERLRAGICC